MSLAFWKRQKNSVHLWACFFVLFVSFLLLNSCVNNISKDDVDNLFTEDSAKSDTSANSKYFDLSAPFNTQGAYPSEFVKSKNEKSRTASPSIKSSYVYKVKAESGNKVVWGDVGNGTFLIKNLELDIEWIITLWVEDPSLPESDRIIMSDSVKKTFHDDDLVIDHIFVLKPVVTKGEGSIELKFKFSHTGSDDSIKVSKVGIVCEDNKKWPYDSEYTINVSSSSAELNISSVPAGNYSLWFKFYNSENVILYFENQSVNVFKNMATNTWRNNSSVLSGAVNSDGDFSVSDTLIKQNTNEHIYVGETGLGNTKSDSNAGTPYSPYENLDKAIKYIKATGSNTKNYQINISGTQNGYYSFSGDELAGKAASIVLQKSPHQKENAILNAAGTKHRVLTINGAPPITIKGITIKGGESAEDDDSDAGCGGGIYIVNSELTLDEDTRVEGNKALYHGGGIFASDATVNVKSNVFVYDNNEVSESGIFNSNLYLDSDAIIKVIGPLRKSVNGKVLDAKIGVSSQVEPEAGTPIVITSGYGYNSGKNSGISPGRYFIGDAYGLTYNTEGEAVLAISGGSISVEDFYDDIQISIDKTSMFRDSPSKVFTFTAKGKDSEGNDVTIPAGSENGCVSYTYAVTYHGDTLPASYYKTKTDTLTFENNIPLGNYTINVTAIYNGKTYSAGFEVKIIDKIICTASEAATFIANMTGENTIKIVGSDIDGLSNAIKDRYSKDSSLRINLDLSEVNVTSIKLSTRSGIKSVVLPTTLTTFGYESTQHDAGDQIEAYSISDESANFSSLDGVIYNKNKTELVLYPKNKQDEEFTLPETVIKIQESACLRCKCKKINGLSHIKSLGSCAFEYAPNLSEADLSGLTDSSLAMYMFEDCYNLKKVILSTSVASLGYNVFRECKNLTEVHFLRSTPPTLSYANSKSEFYKCNSNIKFYVPSSSKSAYLNATGSGGFANSTYNYFASSLEERIIEE